MEHSKVTDDTDYTLHAVDVDGMPVKATLQTKSKPIEFMAYQSIVVGGDNSNVRVGDNGTAVAGFESSATAIGANGVAIVRGGGMATSNNSGGIAIAMRGGTAEGFSLAACMANQGTAIGYGSAISIAINNLGKWTAKARTGFGGLVVLGYQTLDDEKNPVTRYLAHNVTKDEGDKFFVLIPPQIEGNPPTIWLA